MIVFRALRALILLVVYALQLILQLACAIMGCWLPLTFLAIIVFVVYKATQG